jgi:hypothetical protein
MTPPITVYKFSCRQSDLNADPAPLFDRIVHLTRTKS